MDTILSIIKEFVSAWKNKRAQKAAEEIPVIEQAGKDVDRDAELILEQLRKPPAR